MTRANGRIVAPASTTGPVLGPIHRRSGVAGQVAYTVAVTYPGERPHAVTFVGTLYGAPGPVFMETGAHCMVHVDAPERFGDKFSAAWVRAFYAGS